jgi:hypothetical protein
MLDAKPHKLQPVIDTELFRGTLSERLIDHTTLSAEQALEIAHG